MKKKVIKPIHTVHVDALPSIRARAFKQGRSATETAHRNMATLYTFVVVMYLVNSGYKPKIATCINARIDM
jgi:hypothetical protein